MYLDYWSLQRHPFEPAPDSRFFFSAASHEHALATINYAARDGGEPVLISGPVGCGKTLLLRALRRRLPADEFHVAFVPELGGGQVSLLRRVAYHLAHTVPADTASAMDVIVQTMARDERQPRAVVVMLDDWPAAPGEQTLGELRWLLNLDVERVRASVLFTCEPAAAQAPWPEWLRQRLLATVTVEPLPTQQIPEYLAHRLRAAGHAEGQLFTPAAAALIAEWSNGVPRLVNRAAHLALQAGALQLTTDIEEQTVRRALARLAAAPVAAEAVPEPVGAQP